ncbi:hypothetical protein HMPREF3213_00919 [Heyndrickxia coagulans]|uniref:Uncharacterized protein n=1 Tax=Heyndrickxia coagulans TaxID=1398 RepID=A0A133KX26_HEYCO|nr:hypothetical protein HMPREF3213_00919 [Heyndrickxia coagulans]
MPDNVSFAFHTERVPASALFFGFVLFLASSSHSRPRKNIRYRDNQNTHPRGLELAKARRVIIVEGQRFHT